MSDPNGSKETPESGSEPEAEAELLGPERSRHEARPRSRKEPPVIEGEAEEVAPGDGGADAASSAASSGSGAGLEAEPLTPGPKAVREGPSLGTVLAAGIAGAVAVALIAYALGFGRPVSLEKEDRALADLDLRVSSLEKQGGENGNLLRSETEKLAARITAAESRVEEMAQTPESAAMLSDRLDRLAAETESLKQGLAQADAAAQTMGGKLDRLSQSLPPADIADQVARLDAALKALDDALTRLTPRITEMESRVAALEAKKEDPDAAARAALGLALANLARVAESASPFSHELDAVAAFLPNEPELSALGAAAARGVPTRTDLMERFPALVRAVFDAERHAKGEGLWARFVANARSLVTIRRTGKIPGDTTEAVIARMEERLKAGDFPAALMESRALKGAAAEAAAPWIAQADARVRTDELLRTLSARVAERLARAKG